MSDVLIHQANGTGNIAELIPPTEIADYAEFQWQLVLVRCHFSRETGSGTDTAAMTLSYHRDRDDKHNTLLWTLAARGDDADVHFRIPLDEREAWTFERGDQLKIEWTNPDPGNLTWALDVGYRENAD